MAPSARWTLAICSGLCTLIVAFVCTTYSGIELNDAKWKQLELPQGAAWYVSSCYLFVPVAGVTCLYLLIGAYRQNDSAVIIAASIAWLLAITWLALCLLVWRAPHALIGVPMNS
jgi:uncharacterized membrane protein